MTYPSSYTNYLDSTATKWLIFGTGVAVVPAAATLLIASSRAILITCVANAVLRLLTAGNVGVEHIYGLSLIQVPLLWKISLISAKIGAGIMALSLLSMLVDSAAQKYLSNDSKLVYNRTVQSVHRKFEGLIRAMGQ